MRQYLLGVLIVVLGQQAFCVNLNEVRDNPSYFLDGVNGGDATSKSISWEEGDYDGHGDGFSDENSDEKRYTNGYSGEDVTGDYDSGTYEPRDDVAYWESIYGTEDVPDFEVPPTIDGDSIFMDLAELTDPWDDQLDEEEAIPVKRDAGEAGSQVGRTSYSAKEKRNFENSADYKSMMTGVYQPNFYEHNSRRTPKASLAFPSDEDGQFYGSESSSQTASVSNLEEREAAWTSKNVRRSDTRSGGIPGSQDIDSEMESAELEFARQFPAAVESRSIKSSSVTDSLVDSKRKIIQAKKDLINVAVAGGSKTEINSAVHKMIEAKKDLIDSVISTKGSKSDFNNAVHRAIGAKKDLIESAISAQCSKAGLNQAAHKTNEAKKDLIDSVISGHGSSAELNNAVLRAVDAKKDLIDAVISAKEHRAELDNAVHRTIEAKKDLIDSVISRPGHRAEFDDAVHRTIDAKKDLIDSVISGKVHGADFNEAVYRTIEAKKDLIGSVIPRQGHGHGADFNDALYRTIEAKKDLVDSVISGPCNREDFNDVVQRTIDAKKDLIGSVISSHGHRAGFDDAVHRTIEAKKDLIDSVIPRQGHGADFNDALHRTIEAKKDLVDSVISGQRHGAEFDNAVHRTIEAKKDLIDSVISTSSSSKANAIQRKKEFRHSMQSHSGLQSVLDSKQKVVQAKKDLIHASAVGTRADLVEAVINTLDAKKGLVDSVISTGRKVIHDKKKYGHSTSTKKTTTHSSSSVYRNKSKSLKSNSHVSGTSHAHFPASNIVDEGEVGVESYSSNSNHNALNLNHKIQSSSDISSDLQFGSVIHHDHGHGSSGSIGKINLADSGNSEVDISSGITTNHDKKSSLHSSLSASSDTDVGGEIGIESYSGNSNHNALNLNHKIQSSSDISSGLQFGSITHHDKHGSSGSTGEINLADSGNSEVDISSGITTNHDEKGSLHSSLSGSSNIDMGREIGVESYSSNSNHNALNLNHKIQSNSDISSDLQFGSITHHDGHGSSGGIGEINLAHSGNSEVDISSGITTNHDEKSSLHSSSSGSSNIDMGGEIGVESYSSNSNHNALNLNHKIQSSSEISSGLQFGSVIHHDGHGLSGSIGEINLAHSGNSDVDISSGITTNHDKKGSLHSSLSGSSNIDMGEKIGVENSFDNSHHKQEGALNLSNKFHSSGQTSIDQELGSKTSHSRLSSLESLSKINLAHSGSSEVDISSGIMTNHDKKGSLHSSLSGSSDIAFGGETRVENYSGNDNHKTHNALNLNHKIRSSSEISSDLESGSITSQSAIDSAESSDRSSAEAGNSHTKFTTAAIKETENIYADGELEASNSLSDSSSEEINDSDTSEIYSSDDLSRFSNTKHVSKTGIATNTEIKNSISSGIAVNTNFGHGSVLHSGIRSEGAIKSGISTELNTDTEAIDIGDKDDLESIHKECALGQCGISGKLHVDSNTRSENRFQHKNELETIAEHEFSKNLGSREDDEEFSEVDIQSPVIEPVVTYTELPDDQPDENLEFADDIANSEAYKGEEGIIESTAEADHRFLIDNEEGQRGKPISITENVEYDDDVVSQLPSDNPGYVIATNYEEGSSQERETQKVAHEQLEGREDSFATDLNSRYQASLNVGNFEKNSNDEHHSSTYEQKFGKHYSNAAHHHQESQKKGKIDHFQCFHGSPLLPEDVEVYNSDGIFTNGHCRLINLDVNCSGMTAFMNPECQQLNANLWNPRDSDTPITLWTVKTYLNHGQELAIEMQNRAKWLCDRGLVPKLHTPAMLHLINNLATVNTVEINQESEFSLFGTKLLQRRLSLDFDVTPNTFIEFLRHHAFRVIGTGLCHVRPKRCRGNQIYRSLDGSCNNQNHPTWGQRNTAFARILPARYFDGVHEPPRSVTGIELPNPRSLSVYCFSRKLTRHPRISLAFSQWGQILSHDFALQTIDQTVEGGIECCDDRRRPLPKKLQHHSCLPIDIPANDKFYSKFGSRCMNFVRSMTISREDCTLGPADQLNTVTSYLDASPLYGSDKETCDQLRAFKGGRMMVAIRRGRELLPTMTNNSRFCDVMSPSEVCYLAGDVRVNQNPQLAILQTSLLREHNRIADELTVLNPHWDDERVFQETRKIVIAEYQHITYHEWLPLVIGKKYYQRHRLTLRNQDKMSRDYDPRINAATINSFTTAVFRLFHSMVDGNVNLCPANREISHTLRLSNHYFRPQVIERGNNLDDLIRGLVSQPMQQADVNFHPEITEYLFRSRNEFGMDLEALDIQRGRDHGLPNYNSYRKICGLPRAKNFDDLKREIRQESIEKLKRIYAHVDDIDLIVGAGMEKKSPGSILGPVARCLLAEQFYRSRIGDRYFYNNADQPHSFTQEQFEEIKKASFARLLCDTGDNIGEIQPRAFETISSENCLVSCCDLPTINLSPWQESECQ